MILGKFYKKNEIFYFFKNPLVFSPNFYYNNTIFEK